MPYQPGTHLVCPLKHQKMTDSQIFHPDNIIPTGDWVWVFGSNLGGRHGKGAGKVAHVNFHAEYGVGYGLTGNAYAIPTKDKHLVVLPLETIAQNIDEFCHFAKSCPEKRFFINRVGCGLDGFFDHQIAPLFERGFALQNCSFPEEWVPHFVESKNTVLSVLQHLEFS